jgi:hypothetical protein
LPFKCNLQRYTVVRSDMPGTLDFMMSQWWGGAG